MLTAGLEQKYQRLREIISRHARVAVACSGGVDSTLLLRAARDALGPDRVLAILADSPLQPDEETEHARAMINEVNCPLLLVRWDPFQVPEIVANPDDRCFHCKRKIYSLFLARIKEKSCSVLLDGSNLDDLTGHRPGRKAIKELGVITPLIDARLAKAEVRQLSRQLGLSNWNRLSASCLATRIPAGIPLCLEKIRLAARCEAHLHQLGYAGCRVRLFEELALVELDRGDLKEFVSAPHRQSVLKKFSDLGIGRISVDLRLRGRDHVPA